jgi:hypothetical protein
MSQPTQTQSTTPAAQVPQVIQVQLPQQGLQPTGSTPPVQGDIITFLTLITMTVLVKLLTDKS